MNTRVKFLPLRRPAGDQLRMVGLFLAARAFLLISLPLDGLRGYGDFQHFFNLAKLGWPFLDIWVEFPPIFPFLSALLYRLAGGRQSGYDYLLAGLLTLAQAASLWLFLRLAEKLHGQQAGLRRGWSYFALSAGLAYGWWYFDPLATLAMLLGLFWTLEGRVRRAGLALGLGMLLKWFPGLVLAVAWQHLSPRRAALTSAVSLGLTAAVLLGLYLVSPDLTGASLRSQFSKGSWETIWALIDGNLHTGNFGDLAGRFDPAQASEAQGQAARLPVWGTLPVFAVAGAWLFWRGRPIPAGHPEPIRAVAFLGLAWSVFLLWLPGYSPQWVLYLLPLILLVLREREALLMAGLLALVNLLEWPLLLSRGLFWGLYLTVPLRTGLLVLLAARFWQGVKQPMEEIP
ncbi:MAG TPA: hypothetical protein VJ436_12775 [Anaerolineales bacterium]|nr:hypothetical protein [Anaerolineales bacterium]